MDNIIFRDKIIGIPSSNLIKDNKVEGIQAEVISNRFIEQPVVAQQTLTGTYRWVNKRTDIGNMQYYSAFPLSAGINSGFNIIADIAGDGKITIFPSNPAKNVSVTAELVYGYDINDGRYSFISTPSGIVGLNAMTVNNPLGAEISFPFGTPFLSSINMQNLTEMRKDILSHAVISELFIEVHINQHITFTDLGERRAYGNPGTISLFEFVAYAVLIPKRVEVKITYQSGVSTTYKINIGSANNIFEIAKNPLITDASKKGNTPLIQWIANSIIDEWHNGKQSVILKEIATVSDQIEEVNSKVIVSNARDNEHLVDIDEQSIARTVDGTAKVFNVDSREFIYDGSRTQIINVSEVTNGNSN